MFTSSEMAKKNNIVPSQGDPRDFAHDASAYLLGRETMLLVLN
jgi:hypothetical protein